MVLVSCVGMELRECSYLLLSVMLLTSHIALSLEPTIPMLLKAMDRKFDTLDKKIGDIQHAIKHEVYVNNVQNQFTQNYQNFNKLLESQRTLLDIIVPGAHGQSARKSHHLSVGDTALQKLDHGNKDDKSHMHWSYDDAHGVSYHKWDTLNKMCKGHQQSPVDISSNAFVTSETCGEPLKFHGFDTKPLAMKMLNNGHTAQVYIEQNPLPYVTGGLLRGEYEFKQLHFHWGDRSNMGSEHTFDGKHKPLEMHIVTWKRDYRTIKEALLHHDGLAVFGIVFKIHNESIAAMRDITSVLHQVTNATTEITVPENLVHPLRDLLPNDTTIFFRYTGSLTTPPCTEAVTWTVFKTFVPISEEDMNKFRQLKDSSGSPLVNNFRPIQTFYGRQVEAIKMG